MKIRIKGNSIRLRLTKTEVETFGREGYVEERTEFGNNLFIYALRSSADVKMLSAAFVGIKITMLVPVNMAEDWVTTDKVGYANVVDLGNGKELSLLMEKDFKCIDAAVTEDQSDNYENPLHSCGPEQPQAENQNDTTVAEAVHTEVAAPGELTYTQFMETQVEPEPATQPVNTTEDNSETASES